MNQDDFKKLLDEALEPIKQKQDSHTIDLANIKDKLESHSGALVNIESKLDAYGDMYKMNYSAAELTKYPVESSSVNHSSPQQAARYSGSRINDSNVRKVEKRLETLEENANITPPSDFILAKVS